MELEVLLPFVYQLEGDLRLIMGEGAELPKWALRFEGGFVVRIRRIPPGDFVLLAELALVATGVVQLLDLVVGVGAVRVTAASLTHAFTLDVVIGVDVGPSVVFRVVVAEAQILVVVVYVREAYIPFCTEPI
jgi:hypothetical protein